MKNIKIKDKYESISKSDDDINLLPLTKVEELEKRKILYIRNYLSKIKKIDAHFKIISDQVINLNLLIEIGKEYFGDLTFVNKRNQDFTTEIIIAFSFCLVNLKYSTKTGFTYIVNTFWDK